MNSKETTQNPKSSKSGEGESDVLAFHHLLYPHYKMMSIKQKEQALYYILFQNDKQTSATPTVITPPIVKKEEKHNESA